jgi:hypothetical protein
MEALLIGKRKEKSRKTSKNYKMVKCSEINLATLPVAQISFPRVQLIPS